MRAQGEPDALPSGDLGLVRALGLRGARELEMRSQVWRPWRGYAAMYLWNVPEQNGVHGRKALISAKKKMIGGKGDSGELMTVAV